MPDLGPQPPHDEVPADPYTSSAESPDAPPTGPDAFDEALRHAAEAREYFTYWLAAEADRVKLRLRRVAMWAIVGLAGLAILLAMVMTAAGLLLVGVAEFISNLLDGKPWLGAIITGGGLLLIAALAIALGLWSWQKGSFEAVRHRFAARRRLQRAKFGRSVEPPDEQP